MKKYLTCAETAKLIRAALKAGFPGVRFSVRSSVYAGGASIDVAWTDGPTDATVRALLRLYEGSTFDGMTDMKSHHTSLLAAADGTVEEVSFGADHVFAKRTVSSEFAASLSGEIRQSGVVAYPERCRQCGSTMGVGPCWVVKTGFAEFVCSQECGSQRLARFTAAPVGV